VVNGPRVLYCLVLLALGACEKGGGGKGASAAPAARAESGPPFPLEALRFDGVYYSEEIDAGIGDVGLDYLRFSKDGTVASLSSPAAVEQAVGWLWEETRPVAKGHYVVDGPRLRFTLESSIGKVEYVATLRSGVDSEPDAGTTGLDIKWHSQVNGAEGGGPYSFLEVAADDAAPEPAQDAGGAEPEPADESRRPPGTRWYCTSGAETSRCARTRKACEAARAELRKESSKAGRCVLKKYAFCHTTADVVACYARAADCANAAGA
jgi:hypothetical protein